jgi:periplasmic divalent cation tolerance protein
LTPSDFIMVYMTAASRSEAETIGRILVSERLAACINILGGVQSIYQWTGSVETSAEVALIAKTRADLFVKLSARVTALHSYDVPCIVAYPMTAGLPAYLNWLESETAS